MDLKEDARTRFEAAYDDLKDISHWMYEHPEIAYQEVETSARLVSFLSAQGFEVEHPAYGLDTAFAARIGSRGRHVVICAEMDALPEVGHACGHNVIATAALGAGAAIAAIADDLGIRVTVLGTPAEEHMGGKVDLIQAGAFSGVDAALMIHPWGGDVVDKRYLAVSHFSVEFHGHEAHASSSPELGINALDAAVQAYVNVSTMRQSLLPTDQVHGIIDHGGSAPNVIPHYTRMSWYARAPSTERMGQVMQKVVTCFEAAALSTGCTFDVRHEGHNYADMLPDGLLADLYSENSAALGRPMDRWTEEEHGVGGSTDMGNVSHEVPSLHPSLDIKAAPAVNHQREFAAHTVSPTGEQAIRDGALAMAWTVIDLAVGDRWDELGPAS